MLYIRLIEAFILYLIVVFLFSRLFVPHLGFRKEPLPKKIPKGLLSTISSLKRKNSTKLSFAKAAYDLISTKYEGSHVLTFFHFNLLFSRDLNFLWNLKSYLPCHQQNLLYRIMLVKSGLFSEDDIRIRHTAIYGMIHQYVQIRLNKWTDVDLWARQCGIPFGSRANFFTIAFIEKHLYGRAKVI